MEKDFANTQYKRLLEAEALEKKKKKELAREKEEKIKQEKEFAKDVYRRSLETEKSEKRNKKGEVTRCHDFIHQSRSAAGTRSTCLPASRGF